MSNTLKTYMRTKQCRTPLHDGFDLPNIAHITRGFSVKSMRPPNFVQCPFELPTMRDFDHFQGLFQDSIIQCLTTDDCNINIPKLSRISQSLSLSPDCAKAHAFISNHVVDFAKSIPTEINKCKTAEEIGMFWESIQRKLSLITQSFSYLCKKSLDLRSYRDIFLDSLKNEYNQNHELFETVASIILEAYNQCRDDLSSEKLKVQFLFINDTGLFDVLFIDMLINSVLSVVTPVIQESLTHGIAYYLHEAQNIAKREERLASQLLTQTQLRKLTSSVNTAIFTSNLRTFVSGGLHELVKQSDSESITICAQFSTVTNTSATFTQDLSRVFEEEVSKCFEKDDPIPDIIVLYKALSAFVSAAFGSNSARVLTSGFKRGFKVDDEGTARKLEISIHKTFPLGCDISPYYGLFRMLRCKDTFQSYHSMYLNRRALECTTDQLAADREFAARLQESCGTKYTEPIDQTFADIDLSAALFKKFSKNKNIKTWSPLVLSRESWSTIEPVSGTLPADLLSYQNDFERYFKSECRRKSLQWDLRLSRVTLACKGFANLNEIACTGVVALVLLALSKGLNTLEAICAETGMTDKDVQSAINKMSQRKNGKVIIKPMTLNAEASVDGGSLDVFYYVPSTSTSSEKTPVNHDKQIEAAIMKILKEKQILEKEELKAEVLKFVPFPVEDKEFEDRIKGLDSQAYIKVDPSGKIHYLP